MKTAFLSPRDSGGEEVLLAKDLLAALGRLEAKPGHLILVRPTRLDQALPKVSDLTDMAQHRLEQFREACPLEATQ